MTLRTVTYDDRSHKIVPREATEKMVSGALSGRILPQSCEILRRVRQSTKADLEAAIAAAPEYQEPTEICKSLGIEVLVTNDGKEKYQSFEANASKSIHSENGSIAFDVTAYGENENEAIENLKALVLKITTPEYQDTCTDGGKCGAGGYCKDCIQEPTKDE